MATKKSATKKSAATKTAKKSRSKSATVKPPARSDVYYSLNELWHAARHVSMLEENICTLREEARQSSEPDAAFLRDLKRLLKELPLRELNEAAKALGAAS